MRTFVQNKWSGEVNIMLGWAVTFLIIALIAGVLGLSGVAGAATAIAKILFLVFLVLFLISFFIGRKGMRKKL